MIEVVDLDFQDGRHTAGLIRILSTYSEEDGGGGQEISDKVQRELPKLLDGVPGRQVLLAVDDENPVGVAVCFMGFSTFKAKPVLNLHDLAVLPEYRGQGVGSRLLQAVDERARELGCCKTTLEVIESNESARRLYERMGFGNPTKKAATLFLEKASSLG